MSMVAVGQRTLTRFAWHSLVRFWNSTDFMVALLTERFKAHPLIKNYVQALVLLPCCAGASLGYCLHFVLTSKVTR